jgi:flagellar protein FlgJ
MIDAVSTTTPAAPANNDRAKLKQAAEQFEAVFLRQILSSARSASLGDGLFDSSSSDQFRDMADARTADAMAQKGALGIADMLLNQFGGEPK